MTTTSAASSSLCALMKSSRLRGADFLLALEHDLHVDRQPAGLLQMRFDRLEVHEDLALVVGRAARVDLAVADRGLERRRFPQVHRIDRLHVVVAVEEDGRRAFRAQPVAVDDRIAWRVDQAHVAEADAAHLVGGPLGAAADVGGVLRQRADAGNREILLELFDVAVAVGVDEVDDLVHGVAYRTDRFGRPIPSRSRHSFARAGSRAGAARGTSARRGSRPGNK